jgi:arylsulfatase A-like enzyme
VQPTTGVSTRTCPLQRVTGRARSGPATPHDVRGDRHSAPTDRPGTAGAWCVCSFGGRVSEHLAGEQGFDRFYGFVGAETNQRYPNLAEDNDCIDQPYSAEEGYHLSKDLVDKAISFNRDSKQSAPDKPWRIGKVEVGLADDAYLNIEQQFAAAFARD